MVFNLQQKLMSLSVPTPTAKELANQINTGVYNYKRLMWASIPEQLAKYLADSLSAGTFSATKAVEYGMIPQVATLIAGGGGTISAPSGFDFAPGYILSRAGNGSISHDYQPLTKIPAIDATYYWNPISGSDASDGLTPITAKRLLSTILALTPAGSTMEIVPVLAADAIVKSTIGWFSVQPTKNVVIRNQTGKKLRLLAVSSTVPTWVVNGTFSNVYSATVAAPVSVVDLSISAQPTIVIPSGKAVNVDGTWRIGDGVTPITINSVPAEFDVARQVASLAAVAAASGSSWFHDGTQLHAKARDGRALIGDANFLPTVASANGRMGAQNNQIIYVDGIDFIGGTPFNTSQPSTVTGQKLYLNNGSLQAGGTGNGGLSAASTVNATLYRMGVYNCRLDGFNWHSNEADGTTPGTSPMFSEIECVAKGNGTTGSSGTSDNASTAHDWVRGVRVNSLYLNSDDRVIADVDHSQTWNLGCFIGQAVQTAPGKETVNALGTAEVWLDTCVLGIGPNTDAQVDVGAALRYHAMTAPVNAGAGLIEAY